METTQVSAGVSKPSFAKVAASASKEKVAVSMARRVAGPSSAQLNNMATAASTPAADPSPTVANGSNTTIQTNAIKSPVEGDASSSSGKAAAACDPVVDGLKELKLAARTPSLVVNGSGSNVTDRSKSVNREGSDVSQRADSSSELGTKPPSLDGKSITSGTTFALDEKESLRPDDSASVKAAAAEDDDSFSFRGPLFPNSRMGSDLAARARGIQLGDMPEKRLPQPMSGSLSQGVATPQSASSDQPPIPKTNMAKITDLSNYMHALHGQHPDEKLLDAMSSPKDRLFLLRLEAELIKFVQNSKEPFMDFPPSNSFCRMLTHKLADYYHMTHQYEPRIGSVRIFRTPYARVPPSLASIGVPEPKAEALVPVVLPKKIMRRGEEGEFPSASGTPSKATSEVGSNDAKEKTAAANQKLSREEREEAYKQARERIFGNSDKIEGSPDNEGENGMSRTSSLSAKEKSNANKRNKNTKQRRDDSDCLDSRHLYGPFGPQQSWVPQPQFGGPPNPQYMGPMQQQPMHQPYGSQMQAVYGSPAQPFPGAMPGYPPYPNPPTYPPQPQPPQQQPPQPPQPSQQRPPQISPNPVALAYGAPAPAGPAQGWQQGYPAPMTGPASMTAPAPTTAPFSQRGVSGPPPQVIVPYPYGQLPANINPHDPKSQHPIPGSYNRHAFNPKTQSFVPGGTAPLGMNPGPGPMQQQPQPQSPFSAAGSHHNSPQIGSPHLAYAAYQQQVPPPAYGMVRQGSNNSIPPYHTPPHHMAMQSPLPHIPTKPAAPQGPAGQTFSHLPQYGNPATLPQKPNTSI
ncbi:hypothetical protein SODALDRAFT_71560 [Sodiomyces alkalinus F11]|uniref:R3H domain-containing protein n=1 Tax=Sodiomyces alkalinus (strain CBS 110278 / VKM F-3762 / F11) TaxID=1314773 RepID=A0A3N2PM92_SODAK|nr:hypothetical protein SODALDRAFT_71560 [Sodiomyces alkalinus F11]ROT35651.1 hypothetical protein SODALDRAFT_71560 [Sodiomyces alkalinus F11]